MRVTKRNNKALSTIGTGAIVVVILLVTAFLVYPMIMDYLGDDNNQNDDGGDIIAPGSQYYTTDSSASSNNSLVYSYNDGDEIRLVYSIAKYKNYPIATLSTPILGGSSTTMETSWGESYTHSMTNTVTETTSESITNTDKMGVEVEVGAGILTVTPSYEHIWEKNTINITEYSNTLEESITSESSTSLSLDLSNCSSSYWYRYALVADCYVYEYVYADASGNISGIELYEQFGNDVGIILQYCENKSFELNYEMDACVDPKDDVSNMVGNLTVDLGSGTESNPYMIYSVGSLFEISSNPSAYYELGKPIDGKGETWVPIPFSGSFDGNGCMISNLKISPTLDSGSSRSRVYNYVGFFSELKNATVTNVIFDSIEINVIQTTSTIDAGIVAGKIVNSTISRIQVDSTCSITTNSGIRANSNFGMIVGETGDRANISECINYGDVDVYGDETCVGGIVGRTSGNTEILRCINYGIIKGHAGGDFFTRKTASCGGMVGRNSASTNLYKCLVGGEIHAVKGYYLDAAYIAGHSDSALTATHIVCLENVLYEGSSSQSYKYVDGTGTNEISISVAYGMSSLSSGYSTYHSWFDSFFAYSEGCYTLN